MEQDSILHHVNIHSFTLDAIAIQDMRMLAFCRAPYYRHPVGCPNWDYKNGCPPKTKPFLSVYRPEVIVVVSQMNFSQYLTLKKILHPTWSIRALKNPRHWQGHLRSKLNEYISSIEIPVGFLVVDNPEAMGINIFETCSRVGFELEKDPNNFVCKIKFLAIPLKS